MTLFTHLLWGLALLVLSSGNMSGGGGVLRNLVIERCCHGQGQCFIFIVVSDWKEEEEEEEEKGEGEGDEEEEEEEEGDEEMVVVVKEEKEGGWEGKVYFGKGFCWLVEIGGCWCCCCCEGESAIDAAMAIARASSSLYREGGREERGREGGREGSRQGKREGGRPLNVAVHSD